jgi:hypothetical protein
LDIFVLVSGSFSILATLPLIYLAYADTATGASCASCSERWPLS